MSGNSDGSGGLSSLFLLILALIVVVIFISSGHSPAMHFSDSDNDNYAGHNAKPVTSPNAAETRTPSKPKPTSTARTPTTISIPKVSAGSIEDGCQKNDKVDIRTKGLWAALKETINMLNDYYRKSLTGSLSLVDEKDIIGMFINTTITLWLDGNYGEGFNYRDIEKLFNSRLPEEQLPISNYHEVYQGILLYLLYNKDLSTFNDLCDKTKVLSLLGNNMFAHWAQALRGPCTVMPDAALSREKVSQFVRLAKNNFSFEFWQEIWISPVDSEITSRRAFPLITRRRFSSLLQLLLYYWQYEAVASIHGACCRDIVSEYRTTMARMFFILLQDKLVIDNLKRLHPHMWLIMVDMLQKYPMIVLDGAPVATGLDFLDEMSAKLQQLGKNFQTGNFEGSRQYADNLVDGIFAENLSLKRNTFSKLCTLLSDSSIKTQDEGLRTYVTPDYAVKTVLAAHPKLAVEDAFLDQRESIVADNIIYYKFITRTSDLANHGDVLYTLNLLDKPLAAIRSRFGETSGMLTLSAEKKTILLATSKCRAFYVRDHRMIIARQWFSKIINNDVEPAVKLTINCDAVSAFMFSKAPVLKQTLMVSLAYRYQQEMDKLTEDKYLFIRGNTLKRFSYAFPPGFSAGLEPAQFIDRLNNLPESAGTGLEKWSRLYAMGNRLVRQAGQFIMSKYLANKSVIDTGFSEDDYQLLLLWQLIVLQDRTEIYKEFTLIWGSLFYSNDAAQLQQSQPRVNELINTEKLKLVRLVCANYLLKKWWQMAAGRRNGHDAMAIFELRHIGTESMLKSKSINVSDNFNHCYQAKDKERISFLSRALYQALVNVLNSARCREVKVQTVPLYGYSGVLPLNAFTVKSDDGNPEMLRDKGKIQFSIPIKNERARCQLLAMNNKVPFLELDVLASDAEFVSLLLYPVNIKTANINNSANIEYKIVVIVGYCILPLDSQIKRSVISLATRPLTTGNSGHIDNSLMRLSADKQVSAAASLSKGAMRTRIVLSPSGDDYYEVSSLDELNASVPLTGKKWANDTALIPFSADVSLATSLSPPTYLKNNNNGQDGIYFMIKGDRLALPI